MYHQKLSRDNIKLLTQLYYENYIQSKETKITLLGQKNVRIENSTNNQNTKDFDKVTAFLCTKFTNEQLKNPEISNLKSKFKINKLNPDASQLKFKFTQTQTQSSQEERTQLLSDPEINALIEDQGLDKL